MTDHSSRIDELSKRPPRPRLNRRQVVQRVAGQMLAIIALLLAAFAVEHVYAVASCTNQNLGQRNQPNVDDRKALALLFSDKPLGLLMPLAHIASSASTPAERGAAFAGITNAFAIYTATVDQDNKLRAAAPIGKC